MPKCDQCKREVSENDIAGSDRPGIGGRDLWCVRCVVKKADEPTPARAAALDSLKSTGTFRLDDPNLTGDDVAGAYDERLLDGADDE